jgi:hypothetical protein
MAITPQAVYSKNSPWYTTPIVNGWYLDTLNIRPVSESASDYLYTIQPQYTYRPDLLAYDLYGDSKLWWVFIQRNLDVLQDPILDFVPGAQIYICQLSQLKSVLGI